MKFFGYELEFARYPVMMPNLGGWRRSPPPIVRVQRAAGFAAARAVLTVRGRVGVREVVGGKNEVAGRCADRDLLAGLGRACSDEAQAAAKPAACGSDAVSSSSCVTRRSHATCRHGNHDQEVRHARHIMIRSNVQTPEAQAAAKPAACGTDAVGS